MVNSRGVIINEKGAALITVYMAVAVLLAFGGFVVDVSNTQNKAANTFKNQAQIINIADAGIDEALVWLRDYYVQYGTYPSGSISKIGPKNFSPGSYEVFFTDLGSSGKARYKVRCEVKIGGILQTVVTNYLQIDNFARYIWFTDGENYQGSNVWFWDQDHLNGTTHTNGHFNIKGNPVFGGKVLSVDDYIRYFNNGSNINSSDLSNPPHDLPDFQDTVTLGSKSINMPTQALKLRAASLSGGVRYSGDTTIRLNSNGTMNVTNGGHTHNNVALPANGALFVNNGNLNISGTLSGRLTAGASGDINITNNIIYANDPRIPGSTSTDTLGLISEGDVMISKNASSTNLEIDASIMALNTSFMLEEWWKNGARGTLSVFGGIIQKQRGPVGSFNGSTKVSGYSKNYNYDERLLSSPPPFVPTTGDYISLTWEN
ncbi:MAG: DUF4900 domain-containing protein [Candidatus Omnitrophica bacterium]|nr:DUF4900 domain-containing protein [Candidatus Omnitrophota bacterium]